MPNVVCNLGLRIIAMGFSQSEAKPEGVDVEEIPFCERAKRGRSGDLQDETSADYNIKRFCERTEHIRSGGVPHETSAEYSLKQRDRLFLNAAFSAINEIMHEAMSGTNGLIHSQRRLHEMLPSVSTTSRLCASSRTHNL